MLKDSSRTRVVTVYTAKRFIILIEILLVLKDLTFLFIRQHQLGPNRLLQ